MKHILNTLIKAVIAVLMAICIAGIGKMIYEVIVNTSNISWP